MYQTAAPQTKMLHIRALSCSELPVIQQLAHRIWWQHYAPDLLSDAQITYMLDWMYALPHLQANHARGRQYLLATLNNTPVGYAIYSLTPPQLTLHSLYVDADSKGHGIGHTLMQQVLHAGTSHGCRFAELGVYRRNIQAINFYFRQGFTILRCQDTAIGADAAGRSFCMEDFILRKNLA